MRTLSLRGYDAGAARAMVDAALAYNAHAQQVMDALSYCFPLYTFVATGWQVVKHEATAGERAWYELRAIETRFEGMREGQGVFVRAFLGPATPAGYVTEYVMPMEPVEKWLPLVVHRLAADLLGKSVLLLSERGHQEREEWAAGARRDPQAAIREALGLREALDPRYALAWQEGDLGRN